MNNDEGGDSDAVAALREDVDRLQEELDARTVSIASLRDDLTAHDGPPQPWWGPHLVLLYGTALAVVAFVLLDGWVAVVAMVIGYLGAIGTYVVLMLLAGGVGVIRRLRQLWR